MSLVVGTNDGVYTVAGLPFDEPTRVLDTGNALRVRTFDDEVYAATEGGLFRSTDGGDSWADLGLPKPACSVLKTEEALYAGTQPAHLYRSTDDGRSWEEVPSLREVPDVDSWFTPRGEGIVRALVPAPGSPEGLLVGVEAGGLYRTDDGGESWTACHETRSDGSAGEGVKHDIHHVLRLGPEEYVVSCGFFELTQEFGPSGLYRTADGGDTWERLDGSIGQSYFRETCYHDGALYVGGAKRDPPGWDDPGPDAAVYRSPDLRAFEPMAYPGEPDEFVLAWAEDGDQVVAGTWADWEGNLLRLTDEGWERAGHVPGFVRSLAFA